MTSFLMTCPQCGVMIPKGSRCGDCNWSENQEAVAEIDQEMIRLFSRRHKVHTMNYAVYMILMFATGLIGLLTAYMWIRLIYFGSVVAFLLIGVLTVATGVMSLLLAFSKKLFPMNLHCPGCDIRLDELGEMDGGCPSCGVRLK